MQPEEIDWFLYGKRALKGFQRAAGGSGGPKCPHFIVKHLGNSKIEHLHINAKELERKTEDGQVKTMVFTHGLSGSGLMYSQILRSYADAGFTVYALEHHDGSNVYTFDRNGQELVYVNSMGLNDLPTRTEQIECRITELEALIQELDQDIILGGHSFGGMTALLVASRNVSNKIKGLWVMDPWYFPKL